jgi:hypothetical protein
MIVERFAVNLRRKAPSGSTACWAATSRGLHFNCQFQTGSSNLVLQRQSDELRFALGKRTGESSRPLRANRPSTLLDIAQVCSRYTQETRELCEALFVSLA